MGLIKLKTGTTPSTPSATYGGFFFNSTDKKPYAINENGEVLLLTKPNDNFVINSDMEISQRGTSFSAIATTSYSLDRWKYFSSGAAVHTISQDTDVPTFAQSGHFSNRSLKIDCTTADASIAAGDYSILVYPMEGYDYSKIRYKTVTLSFWVKATKVGIYCVGFKNSNSDRSYVCEYTIYSSDTWEKKVVTLTLDQSGGTENYTNSCGLFITFTLSCGSTFQTTKDVWQNGNYWATSSQVNACDSTSNNFWLSQVKLEEGIIATPFQTRGLGFNEELLLCQRYFEKSFQYDIAPANNVGQGNNVMSCTYLTGVASYVDMVRYKVRKRSATPVITYYNPTPAGAAGTWHWYKVDATATDIAPSTLVSYDTGFSARNTTNHDRVLAEGQWTADAEI